MNIALSCRMGKEIEFARKSKPMLDRKKKHRTQQQTKIMNQNRKTNGNDDYEQHKRQTLQFSPEWDIVVEEKKSTYSKAQT